MIVIDEVEKEVQKFMPDYEICRYGDILTSNFEIQYDFTFKDPVSCFYLNIRSNRRKDFCYIKVDKNGGLLELYPWVDSNHTIKDSIPTHMNYMFQISMQAAKKSYCSYNVRNKTVESIYYPEEDESEWNGIKCNYIKRYDKSSHNETRTYVKIDSPNFEQFFNLLIEGGESDKAELLRKLNPNTIILYMNALDNPYKYLLSWCAFNPSYYDVKKQYIA